MRSPRHVASPAGEMPSDLLASCLEASGLPMVVYRPGGAIAYMNEAFREALAVEPHIGNIGEIVDHSLCPTPRRIACGGCGAWEPEEAEEGSDGRRTFQTGGRDGRCFLVNQSVTRDGWIFAVLTDITGFKSREASLHVSRQSARQDADTDGLTGLFNRRHGMADLERQILMHRDLGHSLSVALIDLDRFKTINDRYGHLAGDAVLAHFSESAAWQIRISDRLVRYGGEEFLLVMPGAAPRDVSAILDRIRRKLAENPIPAPGVRYSFSAGIAECLETDDVTSLLKRADLALYRAKAAGRNRAEIAQA